MGNGGSADSAIVSAARRVAVDDNAGGGADFLVRHARPGHARDRVRIAFRISPRDLIVLSAFIVVLGSLAIQGLTVGLLIRMLKLEPDNSLEAEISKTRCAMVDAALNAAINSDAALRFVPNITR